MTPRGCCVPSTPDDQDARLWLAVVRAAAPGWGVLYDPGRVRWLAVRGRETVLVASTPVDLVRQIRSQVPGTGPSASPCRPADTNVGDRGLPPGVARVPRRPGTARLRP